MAQKNKEHKRSNWLLSVPVYNLIIDKDLNREIRIGAVTFVDKTKIPYIRKRLGIQNKISEINDWIYKPFKPLGLKIFNDCETYAFIRCSNKTQSEAKALIRIIRESIWILASSQIRLRGRENLVLFGLPEHAAALGDEVYIFDTLGDSSTYTNKLASQVQEYYLDRTWKNFLENHFFFPILRILNDNVAINRQWKAKLKQATIFAAKSYYSTDKETAFLYDWIAIESLLKTGSGKIDRTIADHLIALFGWLTEEDGSYWENIVEKLWGKRNDFVHRGIILDITAEDILEADAIVYNLLRNLSRLTKIFHNQKSLNDFAETVKAQKILNIKIKRPRLYYQKPNITKRTIEKLELKNGW